MGICLHGCREEDDEDVVQRLQQYKRTLQSIQVDLSNAKLQPKLDSYEDNRRQLLAGADPTQRQRELQVCHLDLHACMQLMQMICREACTDTTALQSACPVTQTCLTLYATVTSRAVRLHSYHAVLAVSLPCHLLFTTLACCTE